MSEVLSAKGIGEAWDRELAAHGRWLADGHPLPGELAGSARDHFPALRPLAREEGPRPSAACLERLEAYARRVLEMNEHMNLVSRRDPEAQILVNLLDSLPFALALAEVSRGTGPDAEPLRLLLDAGSGSGVPGLPLQLLLEDQGPNAPELLLVESRAQKADFLDGLIEALEMDRAGVWGGRLEDPALPDWLEEEAWSGPGCLLSRGLGSVLETLGWCRGLQAEDWLRDALMLKGVPGLVKEWTTEGRRWGRLPWSFPAVPLFMGSERLLCFVWASWSGGGEVPRETSR